MRLIRKIKDFLANLILSIIKMLKTNTNTYKHYLLNLNSIILKVNKIYIYLNLRNQKNLSF